MNSSSKRFLNGIGYILIVGAILGLIGILGPTSGASIFGSYLWLSYSVSLIYLVAGIASVFTAYILPENIVTTLTFGIGITAFFVGLYGLLWGSKILGISLEGPIGNLFNLAVGVWGIWAVSGERFALMRRCNLGDQEACKMLGMQRAR